jgi:hypothetical protein
MTSQINAQLARVVIDERLRAAQRHRHRLVRTYSLPVVREIPRPVAQDALAWAGADHRRPRPS